MQPCGRGKSARRRCLLRGDSIVEAECTKNTRVEAESHVRDGWHGSNWLKRLPVATGSTSGALSVFEYPCSRPASRGTSCRVKPCLRAKHTPCARHGVSTLEAPKNYTRQWKPPNSVAFCLPDVPRHTDIPQPVPPISSCPLLGRQYRALGIPKADCISLLGSELPAALP